MELLQTVIVTGQTRWIWMIVFQNLPKVFLEFQTYLTILLKIRESNLMVIQNNVSLKFKPEAFLMKCTWQQQYQILAIERYYLSHNRGDLGWGCCLRSLKLCASRQVLDRFGPSTRVPNPLGSFGLNCRETELHKSHGLCNDLNF